MKKKSHPYLFALLLGLCTVIVCLAVADGLIGVEGSIGDPEWNDAGELVAYTLHVRDSTGRIIFRLGLFLLPILFAARVRPGHTWINLPLYVLSWYVLSAVFGSHANHRFLAHPPQGFISIGEGLSPFITAVFLWLTELLILLAVRGAIRLFQKIQKRRQIT